MSAPPEGRPSRSNGHVSEGARKYEKTTVTKNRRNDNKFNKNRPFSAPRENDAAEQTSSQNHGNAPSWFVAYMNEFAKQITADVTKNILQSLDTSIEDEVTRRRYKSIYFALKKRYNDLEAELNELRGKSIQSDNPSIESSSKVSTNEATHRRYGYQRPYIRPGTSKNTTPLHKNGINEETVDEASGYSSCEPDTEKIVKNQQHSIARPVTSINESNGKVSVEVENNGEKVPEETIENKNEKGKASAAASEVIESLQTDQSLGTKIQKNLENIISEEILGNNINDGKKVGDASEIIESLDDKIEENQENIVSEKTIGNDIKNDKEGDTASEIIENNQTDENLVSRIRKNLENIIPGGSMEMIKNEIDSCKEPNESDITGIINLFFEVANIKPGLSDSLSTILKKIHDSHKDNFDVLNLIVTQCEKNFGHQTSNEIVFMGSMYDDNLLEDEFMRKCIQHFSKIQTESGIDCLNELMEIVGDSDDFWKGTECLEDLKKIFDKEDTNRRVNEMINRLLLSLKADE